MANFGYELGKLFGDVMAKVTARQDELIADANEKTAQICELREELRENVAEQSAIVDSLTEFAKSVVDGVGAMADKRDSVGEVVDTLDELPDGESYDDDDDEDYDDEDYDDDEEESDDEDYDDDETVSA